MQPLSHQKAVADDVITDRRDFLRSSTCIAAISAIGLSANSSFASDEGANKVEQSAKWDKTFPKSNKVEHRKVTFKNRYGFTLCGDLYQPKNVKGKLPALAVSGPFGAVKEQASGLYAQTLAEKGFITLAFDPSYTGESSGEPRNVASPDICTEDLSAAVDFFGLVSRVDRNRIGAIGICGWGGFVLNAAAADKRIKAVATSTMYDISRVSAYGYNDNMSFVERTNMLEQLSTQRWKDTEGGSYAYQPPYNKGVTEDAPQFMIDYHDYYMTSRGYHERAVNSGNAWTMTNPLSFMNAPILNYIKEISPRPILFIHGEQAHSRYMSETAYHAAAEPKELMIIPDAVHTDLYDGGENHIIPFEKLSEFFNKHLS
ncbi:alpha/beta hydrolase [Alteromonas macleodii]|uniref:alpha/beta hydrolase n=1 Tax=Alteromonas macleodii TaxID=28108 RepID=UPI003655D5F8